jgi:hypothetical protein
MYANKCMSAPFTVATSIDNTVDNDAGRTLTPESFYKIFIMINL